MKRIYEKATMLRRRRSSISSETISLVPNFSLNRPRAIESGALTRREIYTQKRTASTQLSVSKRYENFSSFTQLPTVDLNSISRVLMKELCENFEHSEKREDWIELWAQEYWMVAWNFPISFLCVEEWVCGTADIHSCALGRYIFTFCICCQQHPFSALSWRVCVGSVDDIFASLTRTKEER